MAPITPFVYWRPKSGRLTQIFADVSNSSQQRERDKKILMITSQSKHQPTFVLISASPPLKRAAVAILQRPDNTQWEILAIFGSCKKKLGAIYFPLHCAIVKVMGKSTLGQDSYSIIE